MLIQVFGIWLIAANIQPWMGECKVEFVGANNIAMIAAPCEKVAIEINKQIKASTPSN